MEKPGDQPHDLGEAKERAWVWVFESLVWVPGSGRWGQ